jgi:asparagine synthetase B (glutamine-hydrolysing)
VRPSGELAREGVRLLAHRGPDHQGTFECDMVTFGATRLKILDLSAGNQPMFSSDGDTVIAFNGEIYNHLELRPELERLGFRLETRTDTETLLNAFLAWDTDCFSRLRALWFDQTYYLPDDILMKVDRMSMAHSIEVRPPFLDHRLVEFANSLPSRLKVENSHQKVLLKTLMKNKLPRTIIRRRKIGFDIPAHDWLRGPLRGLATETLQSVHQDFGELFNQRQINHFLRLHLARHLNIGYHLWGLVNLLLWMRKWRIQISGSRIPEHQLAKSASSSL